jgi:hypothetical protein
LSPQTPDASLRARCAVGMRVRTVWVRTVWVRTVWVVVAVSSLSAVVPVSSLCRAQARTSEASVVTVFLS